MKSPLPLTFILGALQRNSAFTSKIEVLSILFLLRHMQHHFVRFIYLGIISHQYRESYLIL